MVEGSGDHEGGDHDGKLGLLAGEGAEGVLQGDHTAYVEENQHRGERSLDEGAVDQDVYLPLPAPERYKAER